MAGKAEVLVVGGPTVKGSSSEAPDPDLLARMVRDLEIAKEKRGESSCSGKCVEGPWIKMSPKEFADQW